MRRQPGTRRRGLLAVAIVLAILPWIGWIQQAVSDGPVVVRIGRFERAKYFLAADGSTLAMRAWWFVPTPADAGPDPDVARLRADLMRRTPDIYNGYAVGRLLRVESNAKESRLLPEYISYHSAPSRPTLTLFHPRTGRPLDLSFIISGVRLLIPWWLLSAAFAVTAVALGASLARLRGRGCQGLCPACGYDLRATPDRCPECGWAE